VLWGERMKYDMHVHPIAMEELIERDPSLLTGMREHFDLRTDVQPLEVYINSMDISDIDRAVLFALDCETSIGCKIPSNEEVSYIVDETDRFIGFASVDPNKKDAPEDLKNAIETLSLKGLKLHPAMQKFDILGENAFKVYEVAEELKIPVVFHMGMTWKKGLRLSECNPLRIDDIAIRFPDLKIVIAHLGWPWVWETAILIMKHENVYADTSGVYVATPKEHIKLALTQMIPATISERCLSDKIVFGSDFPRIEMNKMAEAVYELPFRKKVIENIFSKNPERVLNL